MTAISGTANRAVAETPADPKPAQPSQPAQPAQPTGGDSNLRLYAVGYSHLDTQWRWSYPQVISEFLRNTLRDNFKLFDQYPHYIFNFTGSNRYMMFKEYYPQDYQQLKKYIADGRWFPGGSSVEEGDVNMPDGEAIIRQVLYGNEYFRREFNTQSCEYMLPDCFGFQATLPSILAHCGLKGFSTQKLTWGSAVGIPFNVGVWQGPDGKEIIAALNPGAYDARITEDMSQSESWHKRLLQDLAKDHVGVDYRYYGTGDRGGAPAANSIKLVEKAVDDKDPKVQVISASSQQMFLDLTKEEVAKLPRYKGDLLLTGHSTGELTSEAFMKRSERKNEQLADAAEHASVAAQWLGGAVYPMDKLNAAWNMVLGCQFHDTMAGTALPKTYEYSWNNELLAANQFSAVAQDAAGAVIGGMDTTGTGTSVVVYNPLSFERQDLATATIDINSNGGNTGANNGGDIAVFATSGKNEGKQVPSQITARDGNKITIQFLASAPAVGFAVYDVRAVKPAEMDSELKITENSLENARFKVTLNADGDIASIFDKATNTQVLSAPARLEMLYENPVQWPAWNMDYEDRMRAPRAYVTGPCKVRIAESGPARIALDVERECEGSKITQTISLTPAHAGGDHVEIAAHIDWQTQETSLEAVFPLAVSNPMASYESQTAVVQRPTNNPKQFEVPQQQWFDLTATDDSYGTAILNDCKYGSDKPDDHTVRLTLLYTPGTRGGYEDQGSQDLGHHEMVYAIAPHAGGWQKANVPFKAQRLNQPLITFQTPSHEGPLGRSFSLCKISSDQVTTMAIKKAEDSDEIIVRLHEVLGKPVNNVQLSFASPIVSAREVDGQEREIAAAGEQAQAPQASLSDGKLSVNMTPFALRAFAIKLAPPAQTLRPPVSQPIPLAYNLDVVSPHDKLNDGAFDAAGHAYPAEGFPAQLTAEGINFTLGSTENGASNALVCQGQSISIPAGFNRVYFLASALDGDVPCTFEVDGHPTQLTVQDWSSPIGSWDNRLFQGVVPGLTYNFKNKLAGLVPGFVKPAEVAWYLSHRHDPEKGNEYYQFTYLFKYGIDLPAGARTIKLPDNNRVRLFAVTAANNVNDAVQPARPLSDTLSDRGGNTAPTFSPAAGSFHDATPVTIHHSLYWGGSSLHYTTDGSEPTAASPVYSKPILLDQKATVKAVEISRDGKAGPVSTAEFDVNDTTPPVVTRASAVSTFPSVTIDFNKPLAKASAESAANFHLKPAVKVLAAALDDEGTQVTLTLEKPLDPSEKFSLSVTGVTDRSPNANAVATAPIDLTVGEPVYTLESAKCTGDSIEKKVAGLPLKGNDSWTINVFVKPDHALDDRTLIVGFGRNSDKDGDGLGRYITKFAEGVHFWSRNADGETSGAVDVGRWQMLTASYANGSLSVYKNGQLIGTAQPVLSDDRESYVRIAPLDPWDHQHRFTGDIRDFTIWNMALSSSAVKAIYSKENANAN
jgi:alpha-mannosidase